MEWDSAETVLPYGCYLFMGQQEHRKNTLLHDSSLNCYFGKYLVTKIQD